MIDIKKYANGKFYDTLNKKYIPTAALKEMVEKGTKIKVTLRKTGEDITRSIVSKYSESLEKQGLDEGLTPEGIKKWVGDQIDKRITQVLDVINLPTREQVDELNRNLQAINKKIDALEKASKKTKPSPRKKTTTVKTKQPPAP
jgi:polyhydroxyalkanoate synthesis regulator protein